MLFTNISLERDINKVFSPKSPVNIPELFSGRIFQLERLGEAMAMPGCHAVLYGERGVGKTSLKNIAKILVQAESSDSAMFMETTCDANETFSTLWRKMLSQFRILQEKQIAGFAAGTAKEVVSVFSSLPDTLSPNDVKTLVDSVSQRMHFIFAFDEFDRIKDQSAITLMADCIKLFSDSGTNATIIIVGVADSVNELISDHASVERAIIQVNMPRMSEDEIKEVYIKGFKSLGLKCGSSALKELVEYTEGLPHIAHLLGYHCARHTLRNNVEEITGKEIKVAIEQALDNWAASVKTSYHDAVRCAQPVNIYKEVLLACALAPVDDFGYFSASAVQEPLRKITGKKYQIANFSSHLREFSSDTRNNILRKVGESRKYKYGFVNPLLKPYIKLKGLPSQ